MYDYAGQQIYVTYWVTVVEWVTKFLQGIKELHIVFSFIGIISYSAVDISPCLLKKWKKSSNIIILDYFNKYLIHGVKIHVHVCILYINNCSQQ